MRVPAHEDKVFVMCPPALPPSRDPWSVTCSLRPACVVQHFAIWRHLANTSLSKPRRIEGVPATTVKAALARAMHFAIGLYERLAERKGRTHQSSRLRLRRVEILEAMAH